jgi:hypothetical protein
MSTTLRPTLKMVAATTMTLRAARALAPNRVRKMLRLALRKFGELLLISRICSRATLGMFSLQSLRGTCHLTVPGMSTEIGHFPSQYEYLGTFTCTAKRPARL